MSSSVIVPVETQPALEPSASENFPENVRPFGGQPVEGLARLLTGYVHELMWGLHSQGVLQGVEVHAILQDMNALTDELNSRYLRPHRVNPAE